MGNDKNSENNKPSSHVPLDKALKNDDMNKDVEKVVQDLLKNVVERPRAERLQHNDLEQEEEKNKVR